MIFQTITFITFPPTTLIELFWDQKLKGEKMNQINTTFQEREQLPISVGDWIITFLILSIPLVNLIMLFVWAFGDGTHPSKKNFAKAYLIFLVIAIFIVILFSSFFIGCLSALTS